MATLESFNEQVCEFLDDLSSTFEEHQCLAVAHASLKSMLEDNKCTPLPVCGFHSIVGGVSAESIKDRSFGLIDMVSGLARSLGLDIDVNAEFESSDELTKDAIWAYVEKLYDLSGTLHKAGLVETIDTSTMETIMESVTDMDPSNAEAMMQSIMCLVPPGLRELVEEKVVDCQKQIDSGDLSADDIVDKIKSSMVQLT